MGIWPNFRSPLVWDVFAVSTYATVSFMFWFVGLIPDLATLRDRSESRVGRAVYGMLAMGWRGSALHWHRYETAYLLLAGLSTPLVVSVHTIVSFDFAVSLLPGWHATIFPPYFVAGAIYAGFAMVLTLAIPLRWYYDLDDFITLRHLDNMARVMLATGLVVAYGYMMETFVAWYSANSLEQFMITNRFFGPYNHLYWALVFCNVIAPQLMWFKRLRLSLGWLFAVSIIVIDRHVARALHHHRGEPAPRLSAVVLGHVPRHRLGLGDLPRHHGPVLEPLVPLHPLPADDLDLRDAHHGPRGQGRGDRGGRALKRAPLHGLMAEFDNPTALVAAIHKARGAGYRTMDAYSPIPIEEVAEALHIHDRLLPILVFFGGLAGCIGGMGLAYWTSVVDYPINVGGRPFFSWPSFLPDHLRDHRAGGGAHHGARHARAERAADAVPSGVQRAAVRARHPRAVLPLHRGHRSAVRSPGDAALPRGARAALRRGGRGMKQGGRLRGGAAALLLALALAGCRQDMHDQPKYQPLEASAFFADGRASRPRVSGTVARGHLDADTLLVTGRNGNAPSDVFPAPVTAAVLERGHQRFDVYCSPCHDRAGTGRGMIVLRGYKQPTSLHDDRLRGMAPGYFFDVISNGFGVMPSYAAQVPVDDRWAIAAYIRALQLSQHATLADVPESERAALESGTAAPAAAGGHGAAHE